MIIDRSEIADLLNRLAFVGDVRQIDLFRNAVRSCGGAYVMPQAGDRAGTHLVEVGLHGITASGRDEAEAIYNWKRIANRLLDAPEDRRPVADVAVQVTVLKPGAVATVQVLVPGDTPACDLLAAAGRALISQTHMDPQNIAKVSIVAMQNNAKVQPLEAILRSYHATQERPCA